METLQKTKRVKKSAHPLQLDDYIVDIKNRAYEVFLERQQKGLQGNEISDWVKAETDIKTKYQIA